MIHLTRLNKQPLSLNSDLIKFVECSPDTVLTLVTGEKLVVSETPEQVCERVFEFRRSLLRGLPPIWDGSHPGYIPPAPASKRDV